MPNRATRRAAMVAVAALLPSLTLAAAAGGAGAAKVPAQYTSGQTYQLSFSPNKPKYSTSLAFTIASPQQPQTVTIAFPAGVRINSRVVPLCTTVPACEPATQVGSGSATVTYQNYVIPLAFGVFNRPGGVAIIVNNPQGSPVVVLPTWSGAQLTIPYPNGNYKGVPIVVDKLALTFNQVGSGSRAYIRTPSKCTRSGWSSLSTFSFTTGVTAQVKSTAKCTNPKKKKKKKKKG